VVEEEKENGINLCSGVTCIVKNSPSCLLGDQGRQTIRERQGASDSGDNRKKSGVAGERIVLSADSERARGGEKG